MTRADREVVIDHVFEPTYWDEGTADRMDDPAEHAAGDWEANAKLLTFSPALLRFVQSMAAQTEGGIITADYRQRALPWP